MSNVDVPLPVDARNVEDGGREVDVEDGLGAPRAGREAGAAHEERHLDVELQGEYSVRANRDTWISFMIFRKSMFGNR